MEKENRSCKEHKPRYKGALPNCATCKRYVKGKLANDDYEESIAFHAFDRMMRSNRGVRI